MALAMSSGVVLGRHLRSTGSAAMRRGVVMEVRDQQTVLFFESRRWRAVAE